MTVDANAEGEAPMDAGVDAGCASAPHATVRAATAIGAIVSISLFSIATFSHSPSGAN